jgi:transposase
MTKRIDYSLEDTKRAHIQTAMKSSNAKVAKRASVVYSLHLGSTPQEVARLHALSLGTVYNHFNRFQAEGVEGLANKPKAGRPAKANAHYQARLRAVLESDPRALGLGFSVWTLPSLQAYMSQQTGVKLSQNRLSEVLRDMGYGYRRPKKDLGHKHDPQLRQQVRDALEEVKKAPQMAMSAYSLWTKADSA